MNVSAIENAIVAKMPNLELTKIEGETNYSNLNKIRKEVYQNLYVIESPYGGGANGHLGMGMPEEQYVQSTGNQFMMPDNPGIYDPNIAPNAGAIAQAQREAEFNKTRERIKQQKL